MVLSPVTPCPRAARSSSATASAAATTTLARTGSTLAILVGALVTSAATLTGQDAPLTPCTADDRFDAFDFWVGDWDVFVPDGTQAGTNRIEKVEQECLLVERWTGAGGGTGTSINFYDPARTSWRQIWVGSDGVVIEIEGGLRDGSMVLEGTLTGPRGRVQPFRGAWTPNDDGSVRQHFEISQVEGDTWATWFDGRYVRRR